MKHLLSTESFHEVSLVTWDEHIDGAERIRFTDAALAESYLRRYADDPVTAVGIRALLAPSLAPSLADDTPDDMLREAALQLVERRLKLYLRTRPSPFLGLPVIEEPIVPVDPSDVDPPDEPSNAKPRPTDEPPARWEIEAAVERATDDDQCFEASPLTLRARLVEGRATKPTATFIVLRDGNRVHTQEVRTSGEVSITWEVARVGDDETSWTLEHLFKYDEDQYTGVKVFTVWPRSVSLRAKHFRTSQPVKGFRFLVKQGEDSQPAETRDDGAIEHPLAKPEPFSVTSESPFVIREWTRERGRIREAKVERKYKAEFISPKKPADDKAIEQMVNLATKDKGRDALSNQVSVLVGAEGDGTRTAADRIGMQGDEIFVKVTFARHSKRDTPLPAVSGLSGASTIGALTTGKVTLGAQGEPAPVALELGLAGGDECEVSIGVTPECTDATMKFVNWRKLFYQATRPATMTLPALDRITTALAEVHVRYEKYKELAFTEADAPPAGAWFDGPMMGLPAGRCVCIGDHNKTHFHAKFDDQKTPVGVHVLLCHTQFDGGATAHRSAVSDTVSKTTHAKAAFPPGAATTAWVSALAMSAVNGSANAFPKAIQDGSDSVRAATWTSLAPAGPHAGAAGAIPADHVHIDWVNHKNNVTLKLPAAAALIVDAGAQVRVDYQIVWALGEFLGESDGARPNLQLIAQLANDSTNDVMAHELGHTMGQTLKAVPSGLTAGDHGWKYTGRGHQGPHCAFGAPAATFADATKNLTGIAACKCIMYGENGKTASGSNGRFCEKCRPFLDAEALQDITK